MHGNIRSLIAYVAPLKNCTILYGNHYSPMVGDTGQAGSTIILVNVLAVEQAPQHLHNQHKNTHFSWRRGHPPSKAMHCILYGASKKNVEANRNTRNRHQPQQISTK